MGKSLVSSWLQARGERVVDTDLLARELVEPGQGALEEIRREFGDEIMKPDGTLDRGRLAERVFNNEESRRKLEEILHPRIRNGWQQRLFEWRSEGVSKAVVVIPLLYETGAEGLFDKIICVGCSSQTQFERLRQRGWSKEEITRRVEAQLPSSHKMERADYVIWNESSVEMAEMQAERIFGKGVAERKEQKRKD